MRVVKEKEGGIVRRVLVLDESGDARMSTPDQDHRGQHDQLQPARWRGPPGGPCLGAKRLLDVPRYPMLAGLVAVVSGCHRA